MAEQAFKRNYWSITILLLCGCDNEDEWINTKKYPLYLLTDGNKIVVS